MWGLIEMHFFLHLMFLSNEEEGYDDDDDITKSQNFKN